MKSLFDSIDKMMDEDYAVCPQCGERIEISDLADQVCNDADPVCHGCKTVKEQVLLGES